MLNEYKRPSLLFNGHIETIYPAVFRKVKLASPIKRIRLKTPDNDFLDTDWMINGNSKLVILQHGLEGSSDRAYIMGMAKIFHEHGYDVCAWNFRSCSQEMNLQPIFYHSGATYDLEVVVDYALQSYEDISLIGFSLGGNLTLKYLGEKKRDSRIKRAVAISVPLDLASSADIIDQPQCILYQRRFLSNLKAKIRIKEAKMPGSMNLSALKRLSTLRGFDEHFTAPIHGFASAEEYYKINSARHFLDGIKIPTLILNAQNDPLLGKETLNPNLISQSQNIEYIITAFGGHVGFALFNKKGQYWSETTAFNFCEKN